MRFLLFPLSLLYRLGLWAWYLMYKTGILKSARFSLPVISVGNLSTGGTGKTPHVAYMASYLDDYLEVGVLSRGYRRKTTGFRTVEVNDTAETVGDEPLLYKLKFPSLNVAVGENRMMAIPRLMGYNPGIHCILLDDAFQHRRVEPSLNILLTEYHAPFTRDHLLPMGNLREPRAAAKRADMVIVSKSPAGLSAAAIEAMTAEISQYTLPGTPVFFSCMKYGEPYHLFNSEQKISLNEQESVLLYCGIAKPAYLEAHLSQNSPSVRVLTYPDHHYFTKEDIGDLHREFFKIEKEKKIIITTEKDAVRLAPHYGFLSHEQMPIYVLPVYTEFLHSEKWGDFNSYLRSSLLDYKV